MKNGIFFLTMTLLHKEVWYFLFFTTEILHLSELVIKLFWKGMLSSVSQCKWQPSCGKTVFSFAFHEKESQLVVRHTFTSSIYRHKNVLSDNGKLVDNLEKNLSRPH